MGQALDATMENSQTLQAISHDYVEGDGNLLKEVGHILSSPTLQASNLRDISLTALLSKLSSEASGDQKNALQALLAKAAELEKGK